MLEWYEKKIERLIGRTHFRLMTILHPELGGLRDAKHREWALWFSSDAHGGPAWRRFAALLLAIVVGPLVVMAPAIMFLGSLGRVSIWVWVFIIAAGWLAGFMGGIALLQIRHRRKVLKRNFRAMRIFGYDICQSCGYDMRGHLVLSHEQRCCPECGEMVAPMYSASPLRQAG